MCLGRLRHCGCAVGGCGRLDVEDEGAHHAVANTEIKDNVRPNKSLQATPLRCLTTWAVFNVLCYPIRLWCLRMAARLNSSVVRMLLGGLDC